MEFKKYVQISTGVLLTFSVILLILAGLAWSKNTYAGIIYLVIAIIQLMCALLLYPRIMRIEDITEIGNRSVQHNWLIVSIGISGCALFLAPFFRLDHMAVPYTAFTVCLISVLLSAFNIYNAVKQAKARMVV
jgi:cobalamin synthase